MYKKLLVGIALLAMLTTVLAACSIRDTAVTGPTVHMGSADFVQSSITISKGQSLTLINDASDLHIITNGSWSGNSQKRVQESGAPAYDQTFNGMVSNAVGPFTTSGSFHYLCTVHPGMNLTVVVQ